MNDFGQKISRDVLIDTYARLGEATVDDVRKRIAVALARAEEPSQQVERESMFLQVQRAGFITAGRIAAHAGSGLKGTMINCFVQPVGDSISQSCEGWPSIYTALGETAETIRLGGGVGIDFSPIRPAGALVQGTSSLSAGPVAFMRLFDLSCVVLGTMAVRRGAHMGVLRCDHPDVESFASAKPAMGLTTFNLSVAVTDAFMQAVDADQEIDLVHAAQPSEAQQRGGARRRADGVWVYRRASARALWQHLVKRAHEHGEPGVLFIDRINADNNLAYCERIAATNPCAEQPLPPYGGCCLGSIDLTRLVKAPFEPTAGFDFEQLQAMVPTAVRMLDNVLDLTLWPLPQQRAEALSKRRIGLGFTGLGDALVMLGLHYDSAQARAFASRIACTLRDAAYAASVALAQERGSFPRFDAEGLLRAGSFASRLPATLREDIRRCGLRNSHLLSIAPAGSVSLAFADNVSSGIEPPFAWHYLRHRRNRREPGVTCYDVEDHAWRLYQRVRKGTSATLPTAFVTASQLSTQAHLEMVSAVAPYVDGAISKTVNAPEGCLYGDFEALYRQAWKAGLKGVTAFRPNRVLGAVLHVPIAAPDRPHG